MPRESVRGLADASTLYYAVRAAVFEVRPGVSLALIRGADGATELDAAAARALAGCQGVKTMAAHAASAPDAGSEAAQSETAAALGRLVAAGLLRPFAGMTPPTLPAEPGRVRAATIDAVTVVTADRPAALDRCLASLDRHCDRFGRRPRTVVVDGSRRLAADVEAVAREARDAVPTEYVGPFEAAAVRRLLARAGIPDSVLRFGLTPGSTGCNRNLATLLTAGLTILTVDDDVVMEPWALGGRVEGVAVGGHADPREWSFYGTRRAALAALPSVAADILAAHAAVLGQRMSRLLAGSNGPADLRDACQHLTEALAEGRDPTVRMTSTGLAGDSARYCAHRLLLLQGQIRRLLIGDAAAFDSALTSREIRHIARRLTVTHDYAACATYCTGLENAGLVPPFMPIGHCEDTVFGAMLGFADRDAVFAHLPYGIVHDSNRASSLGSEGMPSARQTRMGEALLFFLKIAPWPTHGTSTADRLRRFGRYLCEVGELDIRDFITLLADAALRVRCENVATLETILQQQWCPRFWRGPIDAYRDTMARSAATASFFLPIEFQGAASPSEGFRNAQAFVRDFGQLIQWWPDIWLTSTRTDLSPRRLAAA